MTERINTMLKTNLFIVGAPKCGTTALHSYLDRHPNICMSDPKEPNYFDAIITSFCKTDNEYINHCFGHWEGETIVGEASPVYLACDQAAARIAAFNQDAKIIIMLRNPVDMMYALHSELNFGGAEPEDNFEEALKMELERRKARTIDDKKSNSIRLAYRFMSSFPDQLRRYYEHFPRENILILLQEEMAEDTLGIYKQVLQFLDVDDSFEPELPKINVNKKVRSKFLRSLLIHPPEWMRALGRMVLNDEETQYKIRHSMRIFNQRMNAAKTTRVAMANELYNQLLAEKRPEIEELSGMINRDLSQWLIQR